MYYCLSVFVVRQFSPYLDRERTSTYETSEFPHTRDNQLVYLIWYFLYAHNAFIMDIYIMVYIMALYHGIYYNGIIPSIKFVNISTHSCVLSS